MMQPELNTALHPYLLAIVPGEPVASALLAIKNTIAKYIDPKLTQLPHITVFPMFYWCEKEEYLLMHHIKSILPHLYSFEVQIQGAACDKDKKKLYYQTKSNSFFNDCHEQFRNYFSYHSKVNQLNMDDINGQLVIANGDLKKNTLHKAWNDLKGKNFEGAFIADKIVLLKLDPTGWNVLNHFYLD